MDEISVGDAQKNRLACAEHHQRIDRIERTADKTAATVIEHGVLLNRIVDRVSGLSDAHEATLIAVRASTEATSRLGTAIRKFDDKLDMFMSDYVAHKIDAERDRRSVPRVAISLWLASLGFGGMVIWFIIEHWDHLIRAATVLDKSGVVK